MKYFVVLAYHYTEFSVPKPGEVVILGEDLSKTVVVGCTTSEVSANIMAKMYSEQHEVDVEREDNLGGPISNIDLYEIDDNFKPRLEPGRFLKTLYS